MLTRTKRSEHITPILRSLHWLPVIYRIEFKALLLVFKALKGIGPNYIQYKEKCFWIYTTCSYSTSFSPIIFSSICVISLKVFHYIACMYFFTMNDTVVFFSVKHIELLGVRNALCKKNSIWNIWNTTKVIFCLFLLLFRILLCDCDGLVWFLWWLDFTHQISTEIVSELLISYSINNGA